jgi:hypothetical protein
MAKSELLLGVAIGQALLAVPSCRSRVSIATGPGKLAGPAMSAMPRKRRLAAKA